MEQQSVFFSSLSIFFLVTQRIAFSVVMSVGYDVLLFGERSWSGVGVMMIFSLVGTWTGMGTITSSWLEAKSWLRVTALAKSLLFWAWSLSEVNAMTVSGKPHTSGVIRM